MAEQTPDHQQTFERIRQVRAEALEYTRKARQLAAERRDLIKQLVADGLSKTDIARELGVTRQAIQKVLASPWSPTTELAGRTDAGTGDD
jgi:DNA invertase Pin-like site-specific DNA recombinase